MTKIIFYLLGIKKNEEVSIYNKELPIYTILVPIRNEPLLCLKHLSVALNELDYEKNKIDIKLVLDEDDIITIENAKNITNFELVIVPKSKNPSKPYSLNYALDFVRGEFLTIYDVEDRPEKIQLKKALHMFDTLPSKYVCLQAKLNYYNKLTNFLTYCFSMEYSMWFDYTMNGISKYSHFFPLGGTSNHFKVKELKEIGGWDSNNVTEDCELSCRIFKNGYKIKNFNSITWEESPITLNNWIRQRIRWQKGFMQTFLKHFDILSMKIKNIKDLINVLVFLNFIIFSFLLFIISISLLINLFTNYYIIPNFIQHLINLNIITFLIMNYTHAIFYIFSYKITLNCKTLLYTILSPIYWFLPCLSSIFALVELVFKPLKWNKTKHGVDEKYYDN